MVDRTKVIIKERNGQELDYGEEMGFDAENMYVENEDINGFEGEDQQAFNEFIASTGGNSASPGFSFGRGGNASNGTWLLRPGGVPSNKTGIPVAILNARIALIIVGCEDLASFDVTIYEHDGDSINLTPLVTESVVNARTAFFVVNTSVTTGKQLAIQITSGSAKNLGVDLQLKGEVANV